MLFSSVSMQSFMLPFILRKLSPLTITGHIVTSIQYIAICISFCGLDDMAQRLLTTMENSNQLVIIDLERSSYYQHINLLNFDTRAL